MAAIKQPLFNYLTSENPEILCGNSSSRQNTKSRRGNYIIPTFIEEWEDFEYNSLQSIYDGALHRVLNREVSCKDYSAIPRVPFREVFDEDSLEALLIIWNQYLVSQALSKAQESLYKPQTIKPIYMARGGQAYLDQFRPDWAGIQPMAPAQPNEIEKSKNCLPGDTKISSKWSSRDIDTGPVEAQYTKGGWLDPLKQVFTYCVNANARYGYIITDQELVVIRIRPDLEDEDSQPTNDSQSSWQGSGSAQSQSQNPKPDSQTMRCSREEDEGNDVEMPSPIREQMSSGGRLEYKAISWNNATGRDPRRPNTLTVNLALWWLHIMAAVSSNIKNTYQPLREVAQPTCFADESLSFVLSETSENARTRLPVRPRKRSCSGVSAEGSSSDGCGSSPMDQGRPMKSTKRVRTDDENSQNRRQTRSMATSQK